MGQKSSHFFLLFLLACDWAGDPYFGNSPLSKPLSSQEVSCHTIGDRTDVFNKIVMTRWANPFLSSAIDWLPASATESALPEPTTVVSADADLTYVFMSIQR
jgi:hypothetical protein